MNQKELNQILEKHKKWLACEPDGERAVLSECDLSGLNLSCSDLRYSDLSCSDLSGCDLSYSNLSDCDLSGCDLSGCNLSYCNLSGCYLIDSIGLVSSIRYMEENFERSDDGYIAYKGFESLAILPDTWKIRPGTVIEATVNANRTDNYGCGVDVATLDWVKEYPSYEIWKVLIRWEWLPGVCVPYNTDGKIRCERVELIEIVQ